MKIFRIMLWVKVMLNHKCLCKSFFISTFRILYQINHLNIFNCSLNPFNKIINNWRYVSFYVFIILNQLTWESSSVKMASNANIFGAATVGRRSSADEDCPDAGSTSVTCFFRLSALKKLPPSPGDTLSITFTWVTYRECTQLNFIKFIIFIYLFLYYLYLL